MSREVFGLLLLLVQAGLLVPLGIELGKTRSTKGISYVGETIWVSAGMGWTAYGVLSGSNVLIASGVIAALGSLMVSLLVGRDVPAGARNRAVWTALAVLAVFIACFAAWGLSGLTVALSVFGIVQFIPQLLTSISILRAGDGDSVPLVGTSLRVVYTFTWAVYAGAWFLWGITKDSIDYPLVVWGIMGTFAFGLQLLSGLVSQGATLRVNVRGVTDAG